MPATPAHETLQSLHRTLEPDMFFRPTHTVNGITPVEIVAHVWADAAYLIRFESGTIAAFDAAEILPL